MHIFGLKCVYPLAMLIFQAQKKGKEKLVRGKVAAATASASVWG